jgi:anthranilate synthase component 1
MYYPSFEEFEKYAQDARVIPVSMEIYADMETPISIFKRFYDSENCFLLESVEGGEKWVRYSIIGRNPSAVIKSTGGETVITDSTGEKKTINGNPIRILQDIINGLNSADIPGMPRFSGGAAGYFGYDLARFNENLPDIPRDDLGLPECQLMIAREVIVFDHLRQKLLLIVNASTEGNLRRNYNCAVQRLKEIHKEIRFTRWKLDEYGSVFKRLEGADRIDVNVSREEFCTSVARAKEYIRDGEIFQVVLSQRLEISADHDPLDVYRVLRVLNPSPYMYCLKFGDCVIVGASPEMLVRVEGRMVETCPIAGTRKRGATPEEDKALEMELLSDAKELAEHTMLVDLGRNDIGKIAEFGTVEVKDMMHVERFSHVTHIVSNVRGLLKEGLNCIDALMAVLPAGTLTGAPKIRAMEIIDELENVKRGPYGGAIGYVGFNGNMDMCITIRTIVFFKGKAYIQAGAGIVFDSDPEKEHEECLNKARALLKALEEVQHIR